MQPIRAYASNMRGSRAAVLAGAGKEFCHVVIVLARVSSSGPQTSRLVFPLLQEVESQFTQAREGPWWRVYETHPLGTFRRIGLTHWGQLVTGCRANCCCSGKGADARTASFFSFSMVYPGAVLGPGDLRCGQRGVRSDERPRYLFSRPTATPCAVERRPFGGEGLPSPGGC